MIDGLSLSILRKKGIVTEILQSIQSMTTMPLIVGAIVILAVSVAASALKSSFLRMGVFFLMSVGALRLASTASGINGEFFLNVGTELVGAMLVYILLADWIPNQRWLFPVVALLVVLSTLPIESAGDDMQPIILNLSTELLGALVIFVLLQRRDWLWNSSKRQRDKALRRRRKRVNREVARRSVDMKQAEREQIQTGIRAELDGWHEKQVNWDVAILITGANRADLQAKARTFSKLLENSELLKLDVESGNAEVSCTLAGTLKR